MANTPREVLEFRRLSQEAAVAVSRTRKDAAALSQELDTAETKAQRTSRLAKEAETQARRGRLSGDTVAEEPRRAQQRSTATDEAARAKEREARATRNLREESARLNRVRAPAGTYIEGKPVGGRFITPEQLVGAQGGGGGGGRPPARPPTGGPPGGGDDYDNYRNRVARAETEVQRLNQAEARSTQILRSANPVLRRHGALTTEFISAAARGSVTVRELGYQVTSTVGKFGGWLAAGSLVYGAVGALGQAATGAMDAASGVNQLQRVLNNVDASKAREQFRDLAEHFNLPIGDVSDAVYQMAKVFKDQDDAVSAAKSSLYGVKVGELDVATSTRYLTAIIHGANLSAAEMATVMDQVNAAQNTFGTPIGGTLAGLAKSSGSFLQSGGDLNQLLALLATGQYETGQTGDVVGTALQRIPNFLAQPKNQATLKGYGIDSTDPLKKIFDQAFAITREKPDQALSLARAIFGNQYGTRVGAGILGHPDDYQKILTGTSPQKAGGSAERELQTALASIEERIKRIGVRLQELGDNLVDTHLLDILGATVIALGEGLKLANNLAEAFNELPDGVRRTLSYLLEAGIALRLMQRLQFGELIAGGPGANPTGGRAALARGLGYQSTRTQAGHVREGTQRAIEQHEDDAIKHAQQQRDAIVRGQVAAEQLRATERASKGLSGDALDVNQAQAQRYRDQILRAGQAEADAETGLATATRRLEQERQAQAGQAKQRRPLGDIGVPETRDERTLREARERGDYVPQSYEQPLHEPPLRAGEDRPSSREPTSRRPRIANPFQRLSEQTNQQITNFDRDTEKAQARGRQASSKMQRLGRGFNNVLGSIGNIFFAVGIVSLVGSEISRHFDELGEASDKLDSQMPQAAKTRAEAETRAKQIQDAQKAMDNLGGGLPQHRDLGLPGDYLKDYEDRQALQDKQRARGEYVPFLYQDELEKEISSLPKLKGNRRKFDAQVAKIRQEITHGEDTNDVEKLNKLLQEQIAQAALTGKNAKGMRKALQAVTDPKALTAQLEGLISQSELGGKGGGDKAIEKAQAVFRRLRSVYGKDPENAKKLAEARDNLYQAIEQQVNTESEFRASRTADPVRQARIKVKATEVLIKKAIKLYGRKSQQVMELMTQQQQNIQDALNAELDRIRAQGSLQSSGTRNDDQRAQIELGNLRQQLAFMQSHANKFDPSDILGLQAEINEAQNQIAQDAEDAARALFDIARARASDNPVEQARIDVQAARFDVSHAHSLADRRQAQAQLIEAQHSYTESIAQKQIDDIQFQVDIGKMTLDQQISAYKKLLRTAELTRDQRRDLRRQIHSLKEESENNDDFELDVGSIKLPTVYDVRRAIGSATNRNGQVQVNQNNTVNVRVNNPNDAALVGRSIDKQLNTGTKAAMRSAGI